LRPNALSPELIRSPASLRIRRRSSVWRIASIRPTKARAFGAYCFKLNFTPVSVIANAIAHPNDNEFGPILYTTGPNVTGQFTKDKNGRGVEISVPPGGFFVMFFG
jgi:hypothetical protein